jgi:hydroxymethylpyrimidine pyrophosphatase-like HAD family hydrolase
MWPLIVAVDFDDTIAKIERDLIPKTLLPDAKEVMNWMYEKGCYVIIWTARQSAELDIAKKFLDLKGIKYHKINENYEKIDFTTSRKIYYDVLIDDHGLIPINWLEIKHMIAKKIISRLADQIMELSQDLLLKEADLSSERLKRAITVFWDEWKSGKIEDAEFSKKVEEICKKFDLRQIDKILLERFLNNPVFKKDIPHGKKWVLPAMSFAPQLK